MLPTDKITDTFRLKRSQEEALKKLGLVTLRDLLYHFPSRYENISAIKKIKNLMAGEEAIVYGHISKLKTRKSFRTRRPIAEGYVRDDTGQMKIIWFNQPYLAKMLTEGRPAKIVGKVSGEKGKLYLANPEVEAIDGLPIGSDDSLFDINDDCDSDEESSGQSDDSGMLDDEIERLTEVSPPSV